MLEISATWWLRKLTWNAVRFGFLADRRAWPQVCWGCGTLTGIQYQCIIELSRIQERPQRLLCLPRDGEMKQFQKRFIKEVIVEVTILSALIIVPLAFLGPGWTRRKPDDRVVAARFRQQHSASTSDEVGAERD